jgi:uncharacterized membrane protein HdeD (DUF308 family)
MSEIHSGRHRAQDVGRALRTLWLLMLLRGVLAVVFGLYALFSPESALLALVYVFGFYALMDGVAAIVLGIRHRRAGHWGWQLVQGVVSLVAGLIALFWPGPTVLALVLIVAVWSIALGVTGIVEAVAARGQGEPWGWPVLGGVVAIVFGIVLLTSPGAGAFLLLWVIGVSTVALGVAFVAWALRLRSAAGAGVHA